MPLQFAMRSLLAIRPQSEKPPLYRLWSGCSLSARRTGVQCGSSYQRLFVFSLAHPFRLRASLQPRSLLLIVALFCARPSSEPRRTSMLPAASLKSARRICSSCERCAEVLHVQCWRGTDGANKLGELDMPSVWCRRICSAATACSRAVGAPTSTVEAHALPCCGHQPSSRSLS